MDVVEKFLKTQNVSHSGKFIASGVSKRGWTTFLITAADKRVVASVPIVYDVLNWNAVTDLFIFLLIYFVDLLFLIKIKTM